MKKLFTIIITAGLLFFTGCENHEEPEPIFEDTFRQISLEENKNLNSYVNSIGTSGAEARTSGTFSTEMGELRLDEIIERVATETQPGPNYTIGLIPPAGTSGSIEWLSLIAKADGYIGYILQFEPQGELDLDNYNGTIRTLALDRTVQSEKEFVNGSAVTSSANGRVYTDCDCRYVFEPIHGPITGAVIGHDIIIECVCDGGSGGSGGSQDIGGIGEPITFPIGEGPETGGGGTSGGGTEDPEGIDVGGGTGEIIGIVPSRVPNCEDGEIWNGEECVNEFELRKDLMIDLLASNEFAFLQNCDEIEEWIQVAQHTPPPSVVNKIETLDSRNYFGIISGDWSIQSIQDAEGPVVNLDYFPVKITQLPKNPSTGQTFAPQEFFDYVRRNLNTFFENNSTEFGPYNDTEEAIWNSSDYLGAIMRFDISLVVGGVQIGQQDGSVICSAQESQSWTFTTIESPSDWNHPVSGNRRFGLEANPDGSYTFFTRGVDRIAESTDNTIGNFLDGLDEFVGSDSFSNNPFEGADQLWSAFQTNIENFVNSPLGGGSAQKQTPKIDRPDWNKVNEVLNGTRPITDLGCE